MEFYYSIICEAIKGIVVPRVCNECLSSHWWGRSLKHIFIAAEQDGFALLVNGVVTST